MLPDGSVVKVNRTVISDKSEDGNSFFYHSTSIHNFGKDAEEEETEEAEVPEVEIIPQEPEVEIIENDEIPFLDETINEVPEDNVGIDEGLA